MVVGWGAVGRQGQGMNFEGILLHGEGILRIPYVHHWGFPGALPPLLHDRSVHHFLPPPPLQFNIRNSREPNHRRKQPDDHFPRKEKSLTTLKSIPNEVVGGGRV